MFVLSKKSNMETTISEKKIERLIHISKTKPLIPEEFIPWNTPIKDKDIFLPDYMVSLHGHPLWNDLSRKQQVELGKREVAQTMYSYGWSEGLACLFFNRYLLTLDDNTTSEYRFLIRELIEEFRHQSMFSDAIRKLGVQPVKPSKLHKVLANWTVKYFPPDLTFMSVLAVEEIADTYGKIIRQDPKVYTVLRKVSELHHIEEGRHIHYTKMWLNKFTAKAGFLKRSLFSIIFLFNIYFMRTLYVKQDIFKAIGVDDPGKYQKAAYKHYKKKFASECLDGSIQYVKDFNGFNLITRPLWKRVLGVEYNRIK